MEGLELGHHTSYLQGSNERRKHADNSCIHHPELVICRKQGLGAEPKAQS